MTICCLIMSYIICLHIVDTCLASSGEEVSTQLTLLHFHLLLELPSACFSCSVKSRRLCVIHRKSHKKSVRGVPFTHFLSLESSY